MIIQMKTKTVILIFENIGEIINPSSSQSPNKETDDALKMCC